MKIAADTSILVRAITGDPPGQSARAPAELASGASAAVPLSVPCELIRVLARRTGIG